MIFCGGGDVSQEAVSGYIEGLKAAFFFSQGIALLAVHESSGTLQWCCWGTQSTHASEAAVGSRGELTIGFDGKKGSSMLQLMTASGKCFREAGQDLKSEHNNSQKC